jgi:hypothetical protein
MKMFFATILGLLGAVLVAAQEFPANMPDCGVSDDLSPLSCFPIASFAVVQSSREADHSNPHKRV